MSLIRFGLGSLAMASIFFIHLNFILRNLMIQDNFMPYHEVTFLPVQCQIFLDTTLEDEFEMVKTLMEWVSINGEIIHEYFQKLFHHIREKTQHATLKYCWGIAQAERHSPISKCPKWTCESSLFLVLRSNENPSNRPRNSNTHGQPNVQAFDQWWKAGHDPYELLY